MTNEELIAKYGPSNARNLSEEDLAEMRNLTTDQIEALAKAHPNGARHRAYLVLYDLNVAPEKQMHNLSTWQNLFNVRKYSNMKNLVPYTFRELFSKPSVSRGTPVANRSGGLKTVTARKVIDLSAGEAAKELQANTAAAGKTVTARKTDKPAATEGTKIAPPEALNDIKGQQAAKTASKVPTKAATKAPAAKTAAPAKTPGKAAMRALPIKEENQGDVPADQDFVDPTDDIKAGGQ